MALGLERECVNAGKGVMATGRVTDMVKVQNEMGHVCIPSWWGVDSLQEVLRPASVSQTLQRCVSQETLNSVKLTMQMNYHTHLYTKNQNYIMT